MITTPLPVRPTPRPGEPLTSYAGRLADANGISPKKLLRRMWHDIDVPTAELAALAGLGDLDNQAASRLTMNRYPIAVRGHGPQRRHGWRLHHSVKWICPSCTPTSGRTELLWQTALMPVCLRCQCVLIRTGAPHTVRPAAPRLLQFVSVLGDLAEAAIDDIRPRKRLYRLRRRCQDLATSLDPSRLPDDSDLPVVDIAVARQWGAYPSPDPGTVATILVLAGTRSRRGASAPSAHVRRRQGGGLIVEDGDRLAWFLTRLRHHVAADGLHPRHVPSLLPLLADDDTEPRRPGQWLSLTRAAVGLHILIHQAQDHTATPEEAMSALNVPGIPSCRMITDLHTDKGLRQREAMLLGRAVDALLAQGLIDYQHRRQILRPVTRLPLRTTRLLPGGAGEHHELALGWIWTRFTHGSMRSSPWPELPDRDVYAFDTRLDPELRLLLHETGQQLLADADLMTIPVTHTTWTGITRSYG